MVLIRIIVVIILGISFPVSFQNMNVFLKNKQASAQENHKKPLDLHAQKRKMKCRTCFSGLVTLSSLISLGGVITAKNLSDISVQTSGFQDVVANHQVDNHTFIEYQKNLKDYDYTYNRLSSSCRFLDQGLDDLKEKHGNDPGINLEIEDFRSNQLRRRCSMFIPEKSNINLIEQPYSTRGIEAHLDSFAIQFISLAGTAIVSGSFFIYYLMKLAKVSKAADRKQFQHEEHQEGVQEDLEAQMASGKLEQELRASPRVRNNRALAAVACSALACSASSFTKPTYPCRGENCYGDAELGTNSIFLEISDSNVFSYFNTSHFRAWNHILLDTEAIEQMDLDIAQMEDGFERVHDGFGMIVASDTQLPWGRRDNTNVTDKEWIEAGIETNRYHAASMNAITNLGNDFEKAQAVIMNGDLTAYAHPWQWVLYKRLYDKRTKNSYPEVLQMPIYPGLGNHDYQNNVGSCWGPWYSVFVDQKNWCAKNAMSQIKRDLAHVKISNFDEGSLSYSWDQGQIHFVQLHNYPNYSSTSIDVNDSLAWLEEDLSQAKSAGRFIVLNFHIKKISPELKEILLKFNVLGVFVGHYHRLIGRSTSIDTGMGDSSIYFSGSATYNLFNYVYFDTHKMVVYSIDSSSGRPVILSRYTQAFN